ncbi:molybdenum ABC transporter ATP-binding protein [Salipiger sp. 1_MG-2023]|uniref:molybdenum ABC transporter ATP-binding protein n=1 Tax=Salipiger sp. 1_MG-2023 TaxID=3062665 RepID=UPI0026E319C2|nr:molybdenum ABC transporter ATP-binding protein [Salipiger sp. 1_MG-2023]MDO6584340.1 molybdenum ABC transporter ATP-binding protein [Salipiger sp. 1_MG-2023]
MSLTVDIRQTLGAFHLDARFEAPQGVTVLFGRSGSGKTSIINAVAGLTRPDAGRITLGERALYDSNARIALPPHRRRIGYIFQDARLFPHLSVRQNLGYGGWFAGGTDSADFARVVEMLGIGALLERRPGKLSGGERQRVAIGRALLSKPALILADEPLAALDEARKAEILPYFERLRDHGGVPVLYVSHAPAEVARLATSVVALDGGRVSAQGPAAQILGDPSITPLGARAAGAMLEARIAAQHADGITELGAGRLRLLVPRISGAVGTGVRVHIQAQDVMIATRRPEEISALNVLPAQVSTLRLGNGPGALVQLDVDGQLLLARITRRSAKALGLHEGAQVFAVLKAVSVAPQSITGPI